MKGQRTERLIRITSKFLSSPSCQISLTGLADEFGVSKTVISDDVSMVNDALTQEGYGHLVVDRGRTGGAFLVPALSPERREEFLKNVAKILSAPSRLLPGGLIYYADILFNPVYTDILGLAFASDFKGLHPTLIMTSEVKESPLGWRRPGLWACLWRCAVFETAPAMGRPSACIIRRRAAKSARCTWERKSFRPTTRCF